ncbi:MAG: TonB-dependent receptor [Bacteroidales bacterium]|nr:TonB-dependent receptor [Bacteroidales bacterium]
MRNLSFLITGLLLLFSSWLHGQERTITGTVTSADDGSPLPGASVVVKGTTSGTTSDIDGRFVFVVPENSILVISYVGFLSEEVAVTNQTEISIELIPDISKLDEVVVVGYGIQKKSLVTGSIAKVDDKKITQTKNLRLEQALQGKVSGVAITQSSGSPGAGMTVRIRGIGSNASSEPLYVVDGIKVGGIEDLNPNDIASIEILKDAASAAIYGSEAANGVVLISTKSGEKGKINVVSYDGYYGMNSPTKMPRVLNASDYINYYKTAYLHEQAYLRWRRGEIVPYDDPDLLESVETFMPYNENTFGNGTDWMSEIIEPAEVQNHNLSITGGTDNTSYFVSLGAYDENGIIGGSQSKFTRYTITINGNHKVNKWLEMNAKLNYVNRTNRNVSLNDEFGGVVSMAANIDPLTPVYFDDASQIPASYQAYLDVIPKSGDRYYGLSELVTNEIANPLGWMSITHGVWKQNKVIGRVGAKATIFKGFSYSPSVSIENWNGTNEDWKPAYYFHGLKQDPKSYITRDAQNGLKVFFDHFIQYEKRIGDHNLTALVGHSYEKYDNLGLGATNKMLLYEQQNFAYLSQTQQPDSITPRPWDWSNESVMISYFGRINYNYKEKYLLTLIYRADGSNKFGENNRFGYFPSVSAGYVVSREDFWKINAFNFFKIRGSWGRNGSTSNLGGFDWTSTISFNDARYPFDGALYNGARPTRSSNPDLRWETSEQLDIGFDAGFFGNKIFLTADYFSKTTIDLITDGTPPLYTGNPAPKINAGNIRNSGVEFDLNYNNAIGDFRYSVTFNTSYVKNEVKKLTEDIKELIGASVGVGQGNVNKFEEGYPAWYFWGYKTDGVFHSTEEILADTSESGALYHPSAIPGDVKFMDIDGVDSLGNLTGKPDGRIDENDKTLLGQPYPKWMFGLNINLAYKGFDLSMLWDARTGNSVYNGMYRMDLARNNKPQRFWDERWDYMNPEADNGWFRPVTNDRNRNYRPSDLFVEDGSFLKLRQLMLGYTLPVSLTERISISSLRFYVSADNLLIITKYTGGDPEIGQLNDWAANVGIDRGFYPSSRSVKFGVNVNF